MWYIALAGIYVTLYLRNDRVITPVHRWLHEPVTGSHAANMHGVWLGGIVLTAIVITAILTRKTGEAVPGVPRDTSWVIGLALAFTGFLWYLVQVGRKPAAVITRPQPTVTVTAGSSHPVTSTVMHAAGVSWEVVAIFGVIGVIVLGVLYFIVRYVL